MTILPDTDLSGVTRVWTTLITNTAYLSGLLALDYSLKRCKSQYQLVALYTDTFDLTGHRALDLRKIPKLKIDYLLPTSHKDYSNDPRFYDCWSKLQPFNLTQFELVVQLDSDMIVLQNMDELFDLKLDGETPFAASHACVCNPYNKPHYPRDWIRENCLYTNYYSSDDAGILGPTSDTGLSICNGGLQVVAPSKNAYQNIFKAMNDPGRTSNYEFADQSLLSDVFENKWIALSYKYNALKTLKNFHSDIWKDDEVKNVHYILSPKPWNISTSERSSFQDDTNTFILWWEINDERLERESLIGINDGF